MFAAPSRRGGLAGWLLALVALLFDASPLFVPAVGCRAGTGDPGVGVASIHGARANAI